ncbi:MAG: UDP-2,3-diacylglucosamine diphosphatase [Bernardetiaceae bacterium]|nr:UDP-2,3-diacylglucosamine diphosphatase [Bernardetiaceae bacterium]
MIQIVRHIEVLVISDVHLGTYGSKAEDLLRYLHTVAPQKVILNGDIFDGWRFSTSYFPPAHLAVVRFLMNWISQGIPVYYITGNHDEMMRKFVGFGIAKSKVLNKVKLELDGKVAWIFHGDVFDITMRHSKWIAKLGAAGYGFLIMLNRGVNAVLRLFGRRKISLSSRIKSAVKSAKHFEQTAADIAIEKGYDYVVCGHIHCPVIKQIENAEGSVCYLNAGDWVESKSALEYYDKAWHLYRYDEDPLAQAVMLNNSSKNNKALFDEMITEFQNFL